MSAATPFLLAPLLGILVVVAALFMHAWGRRGIAQVRTFLVLMVGTFIWIAGYACEIVSPSLQAAVRAVQFSYLGIVLCPPSMLCLALHATNRSHLVRWRNAWWLWSIPLLTVVMVWTSDYHTLFWREVWQKTELPVLATRRGPLCWVQIVHAWILTGSTLLILISHYLRRGMGTEGILILAGVLGPFLGSVMDGFGIRPFAPLNTAPFSLVLSGFFFYRALLSHGAWKLGPIAYEAIVRNMTDAVLVLDGEGHLVDANASARALPGLLAHEARGDHLRAVLVNYPPVIELAETRTAGTIEVRGHSDASSVYAVTATPLGREAGAETGLVLTWHDVSIQRRAAELAEQTAVAKARFLANMSHEIRTPLNGVIPLVRLLLETPLNQEQRTMLTTVRDSSQTLLRIINDILDLSKIDAGRISLEVQDFDWVELLGQVVQLFATQGREKGIEVWLEHDLGERSMAQGDALRLRQVLLNLIGNAIKFTEHGGVTLRGQPLPSPEGMRRTRIEVVDTGVGIEPSMQGRIFDDFVQAESSTTRRFGGTGLGLSIAKQLIELMGGQIGVTSTLGAGSTFWFELELPVGKDVVIGATSEAEVEAADAGAGRKKFAARILVAEDNKINQAVVQLLIKRAGYTAVLVENGRQVLERLAVERFDLILMDCHMPEMDGFEATRAVRRLEGDVRTIPIVALTADALEQDRLACIEAGMDDHLTKPIDVERMNDMFRRWLGRRSQVFERAPPEGAPAADDPQNS